MSRNRQADRGKAAPGVNRQGYGQGDVTHDPKSELEQKQKKANTKR